MTLKRTPITPDYFMILALDGELDTGSIPALCELTSKVLGEGSRHLIMELSQVNRCDTASLFTLPGIRQAIHHASGSLTLANPSHCVQAALSNSVLRDLLSVCRQCRELECNVTPVVSRRRLCRSWSRCIGGGVCRYSAKAPADRLAWLVGQSGVSPVSAGWESLAGADRSMSSLVAAQLASRFTASCEGEWGSAV